MIIRDFFIVLSPEQETLLLEKYKDEVMLKTVLRTYIDNAITHECIKIKNEKEKAERLLSETEKL